MSTVFGVCLAAVGVRLLTVRCVFGRCGCQVTVFGVCWAGVGVGLLTVVCVGQVWVSGY